MFHQLIHNILRRYCCFLCLLVPLCTAAQNEILEIHHINVENGDATMIVIHDTTANTYPMKILIDGGNSGTDKFLQGYFTNIFGATNIPVTFKYLILSHFHQDHYKGFNKLGNGTIFRADTIIDPGGYKLTSTYANIRPPDSTINRGAMNAATTYKNAIKTAYTGGFLRSRSMIITTFPGDLNKILPLGTVNGVPVTLRCIGAAGYTYYKGAKNNNPSNKVNPNNFTLGFILEYGQFRYFTAGDMGGYGNGTCSAYIDQENNVDDNLDSLYKTKSYYFNNQAAQISTRGHICAFKVNHHGSDCSTNLSLLRFTACAAFISAGNMSKWGLPIPSFQERLDTGLVPLSEWSAASRPLSVSNRGVYVTNLYNFKSGSKYRCRSTAVDLFANKDSTNFSYGNDYSATGVHGNNQYQSKDARYKDSYVLKVEPQNITTQSQFYVYRVNFNNATYQVLSTFQCHRNTSPP
ncbi:MAG TPA: hypothetical protein VM802_23475 [Chitinophaga sp.]|uniref:hypothetical protein n=1 Tax=Chitinophaga sp. TaxID=1869181 RepID=UPI002BFCE916|nr:hypothetical protein [Chitinophaga sp.]HVI47850.1 hypothetical protein [Chitinophaga sp.]